MSETSSSQRRRRNRNFDDTHKVLIEKAVELISESGAEALSISALARESGINRSTVYYHFDSRETLIEAVRRWSSEQIAAGFNPQVSQGERVSRITGFVLANPEVTKLWIEDFIADGDIRERYPMWDAIVSGVARRFHDSGPDGDVDAEVFCTILLTGALIGPRVFRNSVRPDETLDRIVERFSYEQMRLLRAYGLLSDSEIAAVGGLPAGRSSD
ncbi:MAG: TetR/AcrR family transcriptional regulator [Sphingomonadales bacterium]|nr:TetR/AcrR family transcriptional regulator [Sphingomonadales bacterium]